MAVVTTLKYNEIPDFLRTKHHQNLQKLGYQYTAYRY